MAWPLLATITPVPATFLMVSRTLSPLSVIEFNCAFTGDARSTGGTPSDLRLKRA